MPCAFDLKRPYPFHKLDPGCPFPKSSFPKFAPDLIEFDGKKWCPFHLPMVSADGSPSPKADWDEQTIKAFNEAIFAFIDRAKLEDRDADLTGVVFPGDIAFDRYGDEASALPTVIFFRARFQRDSTFREAQFGGGAWFDEARFDSWALFVGAKFSRQASFSMLTSSSTSLAQASVDSGLPVMLIKGMPSRLTRSSSRISSSVSPL